MSRTFKRSGFTWQPGCEYAGYSTRELLAEFDEQYNAWKRGEHRPPPEKRNVSAPEIETADLPSTDARD